MCQYCLSVTVENTHIKYEEYKLLKHTHTLHPKETEYRKRFVTTYKTLFRIECGRPDAGDWQLIISEQLRRAGFEHHPFGFPTLEQAVEYLDHYVNKRINNATGIT